jgi:Ca-activated chloride channel homolog
MSQHPSLQPGQPRTELCTLKPGLKAGAAQDVTLLIRVHPAAPQVTAARERTNLNLSFVLDRSGSMGGPPLQMAKEAIVAALRQMRPQDRVSVVSFDDHVTVDVPSTPVRDPEALAVQVMQIQSGGSTALHAGWLEGAAQVAAHLDPAGLNRVILLSDGQANAGLTDPTQIAAQVRGLSARSVSTTAMGFGDHYDEDLLIAVASAGGGNFEHIQHARQLPDFFEGELQGLSRTSGHTVSLGLEPNPEYGVQVTEVLNDLLTNEFGRLQLANLVGDQLLSVVARLRLQAPALGTAASIGVIRARLAWTGLDGVRRHLRTQLDLPLLSAAEYEALPGDPEVAEALALLEMAQAQQAAVQAMDAGDRLGAAAHFSRVVGIGAGVAAPSPEMLSSLGEVQALQQLHARGEDGRARKQARLQAYSRSTSKVRK